MAKTPPRTPAGILDAPLIEQLTLAIAPRAPPTDLQARMRARVLADASVPFTETVLAEEGEWQPLLPGIRIKTLRLDRAGGVQTSLWQLQPGARVPPHPHARDEECMVIEGHVMHEGIRYDAGDFLFARSGVLHSDFFAPEGAVLMIRGELVPDAAVLARLAAGS